ncbi:hypothetical protein [Arthrobacter wenxiniae]|uniref:Uncharacterized protein n=1 Tax=Arthrobacter wenxiniae TaxID=2713570 RepID=A0A7Y7IIM5_9MICC|nr:hypothetical protein [Arthrobacter wenxiniae]NVM96179.1 hypothetical protein [Arthrobacter wenxiniae]
MRAVTDSGKVVDLNSNGTWSTFETPPSVANEGFRKASWGSSMGQVQSIETGDPRLSESGYLDFEVKLGELNCLAVYIFIDDQLVRGKYVVNDTTANNNTYLTKFDELSANLTKKYGTPVEQNTYWSNDLYQDDPQQWGMAVSIDHLSKFTKWNARESSILLSLFGDNYEIDLSIEYSSNLHQGLEKAFRESAIIEDL